MSVPFSSSEQAAIDRQVDAADVDYVHVENVSEVFEVDRCVQWIKENNLERVAQICAPVFGAHNHNKSRINHNS